MLTQSKLMFVLYFNVGSLVSGGLVRMIYPVPNVYVSLALSSIAEYCYSAGLATTELN
jgi:hypothetical protein